MQRTIMSAMGNVSHHSRHRIRPRDGFWWEISRRAFGSGRVVGGRRAVRGWVLVARSTVEIDPFLEPLTTVPNLVQKFHRRQ